MSIGSTPLKYRVRIDPERCMNCGRCIENCSYGVFRKEEDSIRINSRNCVACHRCIAFCPRDAIEIEEKPGDYRSHPVWTREAREAIFNQAKTGKIILAGWATHSHNPSFSTGSSSMPVRLPTRASTPCVNPWSFGHTSGKNLPRSTLNSFRMARSSSLQNYRPTSR